MSGKHVLITGASSGIGRALAVRYAREGARLALFGRNEARLAETAEACRAAGGTAETYSVDVADRETMREALTKAQDSGAFDVLVANAGLSTGPTPGFVLEHPDALRAVLAVNILGVINTLEPTVPPMAKRGSGMIALVGSMTGLRGLPFSPIYSATKAAIHSYATSLRGTLAPRKVDVSLIVPGWVDTPMSQRVKSWKASMITDDQAAEIIWSGLEKRKAVIAFPLYMYVLLRFFDLLPPRLVDFFMLRFSADVSGTAAKDKAG
jgi:short-subunit dehydrogenase